MDYDQTKAAAEAAWQEVLTHPLADLRRYLPSIGVELKGGAKPTAKHCPLCEKKDCFSLLPGKDGGWIFKCHHTSCPSGGESGGIQRFIEIKDGCDWKTARATLHQITGIRDPWLDFVPGKKNAPAAAPAAVTEHSDSAPQEEESEEADTDDATEEEGPKFIQLPEIDLNVYERAWALLGLSSASRQELRTKRGLDDPWITSLGFKTARASNRELLESLLDQFPVNDLLRSGIAVRDKRDWKLKVSDQLCGRYWDAKADQGRGAEIHEERVIIPYIDDEGRIVGLRPHKAGLSNGGFREDQASEFYEKNWNNLRIVYGEHSLKDRPIEHEHRCVICEGEFKAAALARCGIPAIAFQGIHFLSQNKQMRQAIRDLVNLLRKHKIREVVVVFDNEDKSHKKPIDQFEAETFARYTALTLEDEGFKAFFGILPDDWQEGGTMNEEGRRIGGKADWDGRLAWHMRQAKGNYPRGLKAAMKEFDRFLAHRKGKDARVRQCPRQLEWNAGFKEDVISQRMHKLRHEPKCFTGGKHEIELAAEIVAYCHEDYHDLLRVEVLAEALRASYGGYYMVKNLPEKFEKRVIDAKSEIKKRLDGEDNDEATVRGLRAALTACNTLLYKYPKPFTNFVAESQYKVMVMEPDGTIRHDRLITFIDKMGRRSKPIQMNGKMMASAQRLREFFIPAGGYHWSGGQTECDAWVEDLDVQNYQSTIIEIDSYGWNRETGIYLMGDCAKADGADFLFPDKNGIIWHKGLGYKNAESLHSTFCHRPPLMFPDAKNARQEWREMDMEAERAAVRGIWKDAREDFTLAFGDFQGLACLGGILQYLAHPEIIGALSGKPGLWLQGAKGSGKTHTIKAAMQLLGFPSNYGIVGLTSTKVGMERNLSQFDCLPVHIDEWRNNRVDENQVAFITNAYNGIAISKGTAIGSKSTRQSRAATIPIITGEDMTTDAALLSRYIRLVMSAGARSGTQDEQNVNFFRMMERAKEYYRIGRILMSRREEFGQRVVALTREFMASKVAMDAIKDARSREVLGISYSTLLAAQEFIAGEDFEAKHKREIALWFLEHGRSSADELEKDVFRLRWFADCVNIITRDIHKERQIWRLLQVRRGYVHPDGTVEIIKGDAAEVFRAGKGRLLLLVASGEMFSEYQEDKSRRKEPVPIDLRNIQHELRRESYWIAPPKRSPGVHRFTVDGFRPRQWWCIDYENAGDLQEVVSVLYERRLAELDLELGPDGKVRSVGAQHETQEGMPF